MKCSICNGQIDVQGDWTMGHNAEPIVANGRCCSNCNATKVIPARLAEIMRRQNDRLRV